MAHGVVGGLDRDEGDPDSQDSIDGRGVAVVRILSGIAPCRTPVAWSVCEWRGENGMVNYALHSSVKLVQVGDLFHGGNIEQRELLQFLFIRRHELFH